MVRAVHSEGKTNARGQDQAGRTALIALAGVALAGCRRVAGRPKFSGADHGRNREVQHRSAHGILDASYPMDLIFFSGSTDGTLNLPTIAYRPASMQNALSALDGWSTSAHFRPASRR
jgi:hypothetical protein